MASGSKKVHVAEIVRHGDKIIVPDKMPLAAAREIIERQEKYEEEYVNVREVIDCSPWDGALALREAMVQRCGVALAEGAEVDGFFGKIKLDAREIAVPVAVGRTVLVPWGMFKLANTDGKGKDYVQTETHQERRGARVQFCISAMVRRKYQDMVKEIADLTRQIIRERSIYRGKAVRVQFTDEDGDPIEMVKPEFLDVAKADPSQLIFRRDLEGLIGTTLYAPLVAREACRLAGVPFKRGVLLTGPYGTGKTLLAHTCAGLAQRNGITFIYCKQTSDLPHAYRFAEQYAPAVVFVEDIDTVVHGEHRTDDINRVLNTIDGVDTKNLEVMLILTTNHSENINRAMLRKGRIDVILPITPPDAEAASRLVLHYGKGLVHEDADLLAVGRVLENQNAATIREAVERAKLAHVWRTRQAPSTGTLTTEDLLVAAESVMAEIDLVAPPKEEEEVEVRAAAELGEAIGIGLEAVAEALAERGKSGTLTLLPSDEKMA